MKLVFIVAITFLAASYGYPNGQQHQDQDHTDLASALENAGLSQYVIIQNGGQKTVDFEGLDRNFFTVIPVLAPFVEPYIADDPRSQLILNTLLSFIQKMRTNPGGFIDILDRNGFSKYVINDGQDVDFSGVQDDFDANELLIEYYAGNVKEQLDQIDNYEQNE